MIQMHFEDLLRMVLMSNFIDFNVTAEKIPYKLQMITVPYSIVKTWS